MKRDRTRLSFCLLVILGGTLSVAESSASASNPSSILKSVVAGGATRPKPQERHESSFLSDTRVEEEIIMIRKRDGRREALDGKKVSVILECSRELYFSTSGAYPLDDCFV